MYLKSLELFGFKSFPDRTVLHFDKTEGTTDRNTGDGMENIVGTTVIVGPNGSGKSNISDAMRWVLGEISTKTIRGSKMEDVIFGGTDDRRQMNFAEVSVTFDNSDRQLDLDYHEVTVTRRYFRRGDSEYAVNHKPVRLKDIHELFLNTGIGYAGYALVGQGRISEIISQKSEERRAVFDEAAGISKYRYKKEEAEGRLSTVEENLTRLNDILSELEGRVRPLETESERARRYLEAYEVKKRTDVSLWLYDYRILSEVLQKADERLKLTKNELAVLTESVDTLEAQNERLYENAQASKYRFEQIQHRMDTTEKALHDTDSSMKLTENNRQHRASRLANLQTAYRKLCEKRDDSLKIAAGYENDRDAFVHRTEELTAKKSSLTEKIRIKQKEQSELSAKLDRCFADIKAGEEKIVSLKIRLAALDTNEKTDRERERTLEEEITRHTESEKLIADRCQKAEKALSEYASRSAALKKQSDEIAASVKAVKAEKQDAIDKANTVYLDYTAKKHRIDAIRRMEELLEGYSQSVRFIMSEYDAGHIDGISRNNDLSQDSQSGGRIWGPVSRLITVTSKYVLAIETALGANLQNIIVDDEDTAKAAIYHLKKKNAGRATFYPISSMKPRYSPIPTAECQRYAGYIGTADSVISYDGRFDGIIKNLLAATLIFDTIDNAAVMAKATGYRTRIVTLDGQVINAGGSFTGGSAKRDSGMLTRQSETERLTHDVASLSATLETYKKVQADCDRRIDVLTKQAGMLSAQDGMLVSLVNAEKTQWEVLKSQLDGEESLRKSLTADLVAVSGSAKERSDSIAALKAEETSLTEANGILSAKRQKDAETLGSIENEIDGLEKEENALTVAYAEAAKDVEAIGQKLADIGERIAEAKKAVADNEAEREALKNADDSDRQQLTVWKESLIQLEKKRDELQLERADTDVKNIEYEKRLTVLRGQIKERTAKKETALRENAVAEADYRSKVTEKDTLTDRLWNDYELTYSTAAALGYLAVNEENRAEIQSQLNDSKAKLKAIGSVNLSAIDEYAEVKKRYDFLCEQTNDLLKSKENLLEIICKLEVEMRETFTEAFREIDRNFKIVFHELFGGGSCELILTSPDDVLSSGIEIRVAPPGKIIKSLTLLSGGEQAFVAIALIFAILRVNPTPFCIFDEIEAALDESNVFRFADYLKRYSDKTQFIIITHRRGTMEIAERIYGVTMQERGISKVLSLNIDAAYETQKEK